MSTVGFEYRNKNNETPFETFLRYTDEKEKSATELAKIFQDELDGAAHVLDIGTGNGEYLDIALSKVDEEKLHNVNLTLLEPSGDLASRIEQRFAKRLTQSSLEVVISELQDFKRDDTFDVILMSHLFYHLPRKTWTEHLTKALTMLKDKGILIIVLREKDDAYDFKMAFKPLLFDASFKALTIDDVLEALPKKLTLQVEKKSSLSKLRIPFKTNLEDTVSIIEFYLNKEWGDIPSEIQQSSLGFIKQKGGVFNQVDGIAVIRKVA